MKLSFRYLLIIILWTSCSPKQEQTTPEIKDITESVYASGIVKSAHQYKVFTTVNGLIQQIFVTEGDSVKKGTPLLKIVSETAALNTENARLAERFAKENVNGEKLNELSIQIELAKSKMKNDAQLLERQRKLWAQGIGSLNELEQRELAAKNSATAYSSAQLQYQDLQRQLDFTARQSRKNLEISTTIANDYIIKSDINGKVYDIMKEQGELVTPQNPIAVIGDARDFYLELQVDEYDIVKLKLSQPVFFSMDSYKGEVFEGKISKINPIMNESSRTFTVEATFVTSPPVLYPNLTTEANIIIQSREKALTIPRSYLTDSSYVILPGKQRRKVVTGVKDYQQVEILSGLSAEDIIVKPMP